MWGNIGNFTDLAKAAEELQKQAASQMKKTPATSLGFFNMDSLQQQEEQVPKKKPSHPPNTSAAEVPVTIRHANKPLVHITQGSMSGTASHPKAAPSAKGKLKIPQPKKASEASPVSPLESNTTQTPLALLRKSPTSAFESTATPTPKDKSLPDSTIERNTSQEGKTVGETPQETRNGTSEDKDSTQNENLQNGNETAVISSSLEEPEASLGTKEQASDLANEPTEKGDEAEGSSNVEGADEDQVEDPAPPLIDMGTESAEIQVTSEQQSESLGGPDPVPGLLAAPVAAPSSNAPMISLMESNNGNAETDGDDREDRSHTNEAETKDEEEPTTTGDEQGEEIAETALDQEEPQSVMISQDNGINTSSQSAADLLQLTTSAVSNGDTKSTTDSAQIPDHIMEQFSQQLQRLEENHSSEQKRLEQEYEQQLLSLQQQLDTAKQEVQKKHSESKRQVQALKLKVDSLQHELEGTQELLKAKTKEERKMQDAHLNELRAMEKQLNQKDAGRDGLKQNLSEKEKELSQTQEELQNSRDEYETLKERVKQVAGELKERRVECRTLQSEVDLLRNNNAALTDKITALEAQGMDLNKSSEETSAELNTLKGQLMNKEKELQEARDTIDAETEKATEGLAAYKRKAQQSLSLANSRTASAVQAKEEAEMEARAARATADSAMERALAAERKGNEALAEAKVYVSDMQKEVAKVDEIKAELEETKTQLERKTVDAATAQESNEKLSCELQSVQGRYEAEKLSNEDLKRELAQAHSRSAELAREIDRLRKETHNLKDDLKHRNESQDASSVATNDFIEGMVAKRTAESETTISMLQQELKDANEAIRGLKETLRATVEEQDYQREQQVSSSAGHVAQNDGQRSAYESGGSGAGGMPLFYAMEKQAELTQARNEIARLATLVGDSEASKQEALDAMEEMQNQLQELQAKLELESRRSTPQEERVNLEYLKNVILSFLNAKSHVEKKTLLPVIGTVLCLTPQEQQQAMKHLDEEGKLSLDTVTNSVMNFRWS